MRNAVTNRRKYDDCGAQTIIRVADLELFASKNVLTWYENEPSLKTIRQLFDKRMENVFDVNAVGINSFSVLSKCYFGQIQFSASWLAEIKFFYDYRVEANEIIFRKNESYHLYGNFNFWNIDGAWRARIK